MEKAQKIIQQITHDILDKMGFKGEIKINTNPEEKAISIDIISAEGGSLIGQSGVNLFALQHLIRLMARQQIAKEGAGDFETPNIILDINDYRKDRTETLKDLAFVKAEQVAREHRAISLSPMSSYERRAIHMAIGNRADIFCESEGEGEERHIVIKPLV